MVTIPYSQTKEPDVPFGLREFKEEIPADAALQYKRMKLTPQALATQATNYAYTDWIDLRLINTFLIQVVNKHATAGLAFIVQAAIDPTDVDSIETLNNGNAFTLAAKKALGVGCTDAYAFARVGVKDAVDNTHATYMIYAAGKGGNIQ